jgi:hypothetical protein
MKTLNKKELRVSVREALTQLIGSYEIEKPSKKTTKLIDKTSKRLSKELKDELKKQTKRMEAGKTMAKANFVAA